MTRFGFLTIACFALALIPASVSAQPQLQQTDIQDPLCNVELYNQMQQRARLQGQRELVTIENLIYKPDSVLEYSCYERLVNSAPSGLPNSNLGNEHINPIRELIQQFVYANFGHTYLGGRVPDNGIASGVGTGDAYACDAMAAVWALAKCQNFAPTEPQDGFYGLVEFASSTTDIRRLPYECALAQNIDFGVVAAMPAAVLYTSATYDTTQCGDPIPTGNVVEVPLRQNDPQGRPERYNEKFCPNPACTYTPTAEDDGNCAP